MEVICGLVFVNLDPEATPLAELLGDLPQRLERYDIPSLVRADGGRDDTQGANWKVVADNYLEGYHVPIAHPGLMRLLDYERYERRHRRRLRLVRGADAHRAIGEPHQRLYQRLVRADGRLTEADRDVWRYVFIYPNTAIDLYPDQVGWWQINPDGPERTRDAFALLRPREEGVRDARSAAQRRVNDLVGDEDVELVEARAERPEDDGYRCGPLNEREACGRLARLEGRADLAAAGERR